MNSICAWASQHSHLDISFTSPNDYLTRGQNFSREAQRLWALEENAPSITNVQALMILGTDVTIRGNDKLGVQYTTQAMYLLRHLPPASHWPVGGSPSQRNYNRALTCLFWGVNYLDMYAAIARLMKTRSRLMRRRTFALSLLRPRTEPDWDLESLPTVTDHIADTTTFWTAYPLAHTTMPYRRNRLFVEVARLSRILRKAIQLLLYDAKHMSAHDLYHAVLTLGAEFENWHGSLATELKDIRDTPAPAYDMMYVTYVFRTFPH